MKLRQILVLYIAVLALAGCGRPDHRSDADLTASQIADRVRPATVQVVVRIKAEGEVPQLSLDGLKLVNDLRIYLNGGSVTQGQAFATLLALFTNNPGAYLVEGPSRHTSSEFSSLGSGFIITPDGYILTNAHVVQPSDDELQKAALSSLTDAAQAQTEQFRTVVQSLMPGFSIDQSDADKISAILVAQQAQHGRFSYTRDVRVILTVAHGDSANELRLLSCAIKKMGEPTPGKDVAVLKIDGSDLPTVPVARSLAAGEARVGANVYVMGYPGNVALTPLFKFESNVQPSLTTGHVSGIKDVTGGWQDIQMDAAINPGNSGGPVFNGRGEVIGLATFQLNETQGVNFALSIDLARQFINAVGIVPQQSPFTEKYRAALAEYERPGHGHALRLFRELALVYPNISGPREFVNELSAEGNVQAAGDERAGAGSAGVERARPREVQASTPASAPRGTSHSRFLIVIAAVFGVVVLAGIAVLVSIGKN